MNYSTFVPGSLLQSAVACLWVVEGNETDWQKITPDGCPEVIFHFGDPYMIRQDDQDILQEAALAAGQLDHPIFIRATGRSGVVGIKFKPTGMWKLMGCTMSDLYNATVPLCEVWRQDTRPLISQLGAAGDNATRIWIVESFLTKSLDPERASPLDNMIGQIIRHHGQDTVNELCIQFGMSSRKAERLFKTQVGVSIKMYSRIVRFNHVFKLLQQPSLTKAEATYLSGYFDQAHFNREFRQFTGENPELYFRQKHAFSNFFLNR